MEDLLQEDYVQLLRRLIVTPRHSREEGQAADLMEETVRRWGLVPQRLGNNLWLTDPSHDDRRPTLLLNAHIDTVRPVASWTRSPYSPDIEDDRLYGLGSNDCGGGLVTLLHTFRRLTACGQDGLRRPWNLVYLASCEEEVSGKNGIESVIKSGLLPRIDVAVVGEPTGLQPATAEKGLMVVDAVAHGKSGHAARGEGVNALYEALDDLCFVRDYKFDRVSPLLGPTVMQATIIQAGTQHNVVPDECHFTLDVRTNELYSNEEVISFLQSHMKSQLTARSTRLCSSRIAEDHPLVCRCRQLGLTPFGSPTLSDQALMPWPSLKLGPGQSARSHSADEYICLSELQAAVRLYTTLLSE
jgi:acetylornithine deacetylase